MKSFFQNKVIKEVSKLKFANFQLSILQFSKNDAVTSLFGKLEIENYLKIGNWKLKIRDFKEKTVIAGASLVVESSLI